MDNYKNNQRQTVKSKYAKMETEREPYLERARNAAKLTIPALYPPEGSNGSTDYPTPFQGLGARGVKNLAAKMLLTLFPANTPFWRYLLSDASLQKLNVKPEARAALEADFGRIERMTQDEVESTGMRPKFYETNLNLIVAGTSVVHVIPTGGVRVFKLDSFVVRLDPTGNLLELITLEKVSKAALPEDVVLACGVNEMDDFKDSIEVYTYVCRSEGRFKVCQEINGKIVPGSEGFYPIDQLPWIVLRFYAVDGESYGRSYVEEHMGDLVTLEVLSQCITEGSVAAARVVYMVKPGGETKKKAFAEASNGDVIDGDAQDVTTPQTNKAYDFRTALELSNQIIERLSYAFLLNSAIQRQAERVTAEEIRYMARELEDSLGGIYSLMSQEFQLPLVRVLLANMAKKGQIPKLPKGIAEPTIITGLSALGRGQDLDKLQSFLQFASQLGPQAIQAINMSDYLTRVATGLGMNVDGLVKTQEQLQAEQQAQMISQMTPQLADAFAQSQGGADVMTQMADQMSQPEAVTQ